MKAWKINAIGISVAGVLAMSGIGPAAAHAAVEFTPANGEHAVLDGSQTILPHKFIVNGNTVSCEFATLAGTLTGNQSSVTVEPKYSGCSVSTILGTLPATVTINGCDYVLHGGTKTVFTLWTTLIDIVCPEKKAIELHIYESTTRHSEGKSLCTLTIGTQSNLAHIWVGNLPGTPDDIEVEPEVSGVHVVVDGPSFPCGSTTTSGEYEGDTIVRATSTNETYTNLTISGE